MTGSNLSNTSQKKRPTYLNVLLILTGISLIFILVAGVKPMFSGPMNEAQLQQKEVENAKTIKAMQAFYDDEESKQEIALVFENKFEVVKYIHTQAFWSHHVLQLIVFLLGATGVYFMFKMNKIGFHLYIIYCLVSVGGVYLVLPQKFITSIEVITNLVISGVFVWMYATNLKHFSNQNQQENTEYTYKN